MVAEPPARLRAVHEKAQNVTLVVERGGATETYELARDALPRALPAVGENLDNALLSAIAAADARKRAARRVFALLDRRLRSRAELQSRLVEEGYPAEAVAAVLDAFADKGLHSDESFASAFCRDALRDRPLGRAWLRAKLLRRGVADEVIAAVLARELPAEREAELARDAAEQRWRRESGERSPRSEARVMRFLASRGFPAALCRRATWETGPPRGPADPEDVS